MRALAKGAFGDHVKVHLDGLSDESRVFSHDEMDRFHKTALFTGGLFCDADDLQCHRVLMHGAHPSLQVDADGRDAQEPFR